MLRIPQLPTKRRAMRFAFQAEAKARGRGDYRRAMATPASNDRAPLKYGV